MLNHKVYIIGIPHTTWNTFPAEAPLSVHSNNYLRAIDLIKSGLDVNNQVKIYHKAISTLNRFAVGALEQSKATLLESTEVKDYSHWFLLLSKYSSMENSPTMRLIHPPGEEVQGIASTLLQILNQERTRTALSNKGLLDGTLIRQRAFARAAEMESGVVELFSPLLTRQKGGTKS